MAWVDGLPVRDLGDVMPGVPMPKPFYRKNWDNPYRFKLNPYGDEFEYANFAQLASRWQMLNMTAANFRFEGGSSIDWRSSGAAQGILKPIPPYDFDCVLEVQRLIINDGSTPTDNYPGLSLFNASGNGLGAGVHQNGNMYHNFISGFNDPGAFSGNNFPLWSPDSRHQWFNLRRVGNAMQVRTSNNGTSWGSFTGLEGTGVTVAYIGIIRYRSLGGPTGWCRLHRINFYPLPAGFTG